MSLILLLWGLLFSYPLHILFFRIVSSLHSSAMTPLVAIMDILEERDFILSNPIDIPENAVRMSLSTWEYRRACGRFTFSTPSMVATQKQSQKCLMIATIPNIPQRAAKLLEGIKAKFKGEISPLEGAGDSGRNASAFLEWVWSGRDAKNKDATMYDPPLLT
ncbi:hypothetical protein AMTRI_Chr12g235840 [Amborella trichopoda]